MFQSAEGWQLGSSLSVLFFPHSPAWEFRSSYLEPCTPHCLTLVNWNIYVYWTSNSSVWILKRAACLVFTAVSLASACPLAPVISIERIQMKRSVVRKMFITRQSGAHWRVRMAPGQREHCSDLQFRKVLCYFEVSGGDSFLRRNFLSDWWVVWMDSYRRATEVSFFFITEPPAIQWS